VQPSRSDDHHNISHILVGARYELGDRLGEGASSITFRAVDRKLGRTVAVKLLRQHYAADRQFVNRFEREARLAASVSHPNIVDVYDYGTHRDTYFIVMQYVEGSDLRQRLDQDRPLSIADAANIVGQILAGLSAIHAIGIIHRDIKPHNVLVGRDGIARLTDFGVAHTSLETGLTTDGTAIGTAAYMAPEQARGGALSIRTDLYAVGVVLFECLTGKLPFQASNPMAVMLAHLQRPAPLPSEVAPHAGIPAAMDALILRALAKDPADRFADASDMAQALRIAVRQSPSSAVETTRQLPSIAAAETAALPAVEPPLRARPVHEHGFTGARRPPSRLKWLGPLILIALALLLGGVALAGSFSSRWNGDDGNDSQIPAAISDPTSTATAAATMTATATTITISGTVETATPRAPSPTASATSTATATPTEIATSTATSSATETAMPSPTPSPTTRPSPSVTPMPTDTPVPGDTDDSEAGTAPTIVPSNGGASGSSANRQAGVLTFSPSDWSGACTGIDTSMYGRESVAIRGAQSSCPSATLSFTLDEAPEGTTTLTINGFNGENIPLQAAIEINGSRSSSSNQFFEVWDGNMSSVPSTWGRAELSLPPGYLQAGRNTITLISTTPGSGDWGPPYLLLGEATLEL
jgi:serine/threonine protein kinase